jgi:methylmalonyl-CoA mutase N-terminal domain/subunit
MDQGEQLQVGVNCFPAEEATPTERLQIDSRTQERQVRKLKKFKAERDRKKVEEALALLRHGAQGPENLMPYIVQAVKDNCTLGEVSDSLRQVFGKHKEILTI